MNTLLRRPIEENHSQSQIFKLFAGLRKHRYAPCDDDIQALLRQFMSRKNDLEPKGYAKFMLCIADLGYLPDEKTLKPLYQMARRGVNFDGNPLKQEDRCLSIHKTLHALAIMACHPDAENRQNEIYTYATNIIEFYKNQHTQDLVFDNKQLYDAALFFGFVGDDVSAPKSDEKPSKGEKRLSRIFQQAAENMDGVEIINDHHVNMKRAQHSVDLVMKHFGNARVYLERDGHTHLLQRYDDRGQLNNIGFNGRTRFQTALLSQEVDKSSLFLRMTSDAQRRLENYLDYNETHALSLVQNFLEKIIFDSRDFGSGHRVHHVDFTKLGFTQEQIYVP